MKKDKILVAMSGGVDSSVAAYLLKKDGYDCMGAIMKLFDKGSTEHDETHTAACVAELLGIPFAVCDFSADFKKHVMDYFVTTYMEGGTPNPCVECNRTMKFGKLYEAARSYGCAKLATGHYAKIEQDPNGRYLIRAASDATKDQTYVLWALSQEQLSRTLFPLGTLSKQEIREIAMERGFCNANQKDSQDICFIENGDYVSFIEAYTQKSFEKGNFVGLDGRILGQHRGLIRYTVGQRKGLGIAFGEPTYVCAKNAADNTVILGKNEDLFTRELRAHRINLIAFDRVPSPIRVQAKVRYSAKAANATLEQTDTDTLHLRFDEPQRAVCTGQSVVLYDGDLLLGGGIIC